MCCKIELQQAELPPIERNRVLTLIVRLFSLCEGWERRPRNSNPCRGIERAHEEPRDQTLSTDEPAALSSALVENCAVTGYTQLA
ncbi:MAG: hypothetical protein OXF68_07320 [Gammaproteobacteria bacterium]|nr:hypothetical protein [Gammaproteobacteria bacterium]MCY4342375.1 hypothetical protein [Gammaproteobacteria bacterium]